MDDWDIAAQPHCPDCDVAMRDDPPGFRCPACGHVEPYDVDVVMPPEFYGPSIRGG